MTRNSLGRLVKALGVLACVLLCLLAVQMPVGAAMPAGDSGNAGWHGGTTSHASAAAPQIRPGPPGGGGNGQCLQLFLISTESFNYTDNRINIAVKNNCGRNVGAIGFHIEGAVHCANGTFPASFNGDTGLGYVNNRQLRNTGFITHSYCSDRCSCTPVRATASSIPTRCS